MTIGGALSELNNLLNADDIPCYYKPSIKAVIDTIALEQEAILDKIRAEINTMPCAITSMREIYINRDKAINILDKYKAESEGWSL